MGMVICYPVAGITQNCWYGCGCWCGPHRSGGPPGLDPWVACPARRSFVDNSTKEPTT